MSVSAYPLQWPQGRDRTEPGRRQNGQFKVSFTTAMEDLFSELERLGARHMVLSTNVPLRNDGKPYAPKSLTAVQREAAVEDPGAAVYFLWYGKAAGPRPWWRVLGVEPFDMTEEGIRRAFRRKLMEAHPDRGGSEDQVRDLVRARDEALGGRYALACDRWRRVEHNVRALGLTVAALRGLERWGTGDMVAASFHGFKRLRGPVAAEGAGA